MQRTFHLFQLWFLIPGLLLIAASVYIPARYLYQQLFWNRTRATIIGTIPWEPGHGDALFVDMDFTDAQGFVHRIRVDSESYPAGDPDHADLYYDPVSPVKFAMVNHFKYMVVLFLPFALFLLYLGWPQKAPHTRR